MGKNKDLLTRIKQASLVELAGICAEIRHYILTVLSEGEGHLGASLGAVELTVALYKVFDFPSDNLIWDVGHQAYAHKIIGGREEQFKSNRQKGGISGFPKRSESEFDKFGTGHSSTSISAVLGMAYANFLNHTNKQHIAVIGDASIVSGMALEGLNHAGATKVPILVILNDNNIGIDPSVGALKKHFTNIDAKANIFHCFDFEYLGPIDGHCLETLIDSLEAYKKNPTQLVLHCRTVKGKGMVEAENNQVRWHAPGRFDMQTGKLLKSQKNTGHTKFQDVFGLTIEELAHSDKDIVAITPAMPSGSSLKFMMKTYPKRALDVGIAEQHALTFAAGLACEGKKPFVTIYSTFLQRAYDQWIHDIALQKLPVVLCVDRVGLVGHDGATHHGVFDAAFLKPIPNTTIWHPKDEIELRQCLYMATQTKGPMVIRYPRGYGKLKYWRVPFLNLDYQWKKYLAPSKNIVVSSGTIFEEIDQILLSKLKIELVHVLQINPLPKDLLAYLVTKNNILMVEESIKSGGVMEGLANALLARDARPRIKILAIDNGFVEHGSVQDLKQICQLDKKSLSKNIERFFCVG